jgi:hypothetical protein
MTSQHALQERDPVDRYATSTHVADNEIFISRRIASSHHRKALWFYAPFNQIQVGILTPSDSKKKVSIVYWHKRSSSLKYLFRGG